VDPGSVDCPGFIFVADNAVSALSLIGQDERRNEMPRPGATFGRGLIGCEWLHLTWRIHIEWPEMVK
jgi:hypothetical protein